jgi:rare lipoprotein A
MTRSRYISLLLIITTPAHAFDEWDARIARLPEEIGIASIYNDHRTASGERFDAKALTCAHRSRPLCTASEDQRGICPSRSYVTVRLGRKAVRCRVNDRGPFLKGRVIDLTQGAANRLGLSSKQGLARVTLD